MISFTAKAHCQPHRCAAPTIPMPTITTTDRTCVSASSTHSARPSLKWTAMASKSRLCLVCQLVRRTSKKEPSWKERWSACCKQSHCRSGAESPEASDLLRLRGVQEEPKLQLKPALTSTVDAVARYICRGTNGTSTASTTTVYITPVGNGTTGRRKAKGTGGANGTARQACITAAVIVRMVHASEWSMLSFLVC
jgi:hypothetical protein